MQTKLILAHVHRTVNFHCVFQRHLEQELCSAPRTVHHIYRVCRHYIVIFTDSHVDIYEAINNL